MSYHTEKIAAVMLVYSDVVGQMKTFAREELAEHWDPSSNLEMLFPYIPQEREEGFFVSVRVSF